MDDPELRRYGRRTTMMTQESYIGLKTCPTSIALAESARQVREHSRSVEVSRSLTTMATPDDRLLDTFKALVTNLHAKFGQIKERSVLLLPGECPVKGGQR
jgi:hypothetical protein